ncbi:L-type lectin-domain containing receptor kinase VIII.2 [Thalictrum thalictroides]|uniref:L-type lectin-domain containing receptor kinase VIII.2 n=1 Tax=Thalictrum thalictroides TaxID=46969 RepID=A0A7J6V4I5_THATH|nr:L-type lectin-domain containing receptor kinase VIII.2 [Thalictrum thalictroides]
MAVVMVLSLSRYSFSLMLVVFYLVTLAAKPISSFSLKRFDKDANFDPKITLYGDAKIVDGGSSVKITPPSNSSAGRLMYKYPIRFVDGKTRKPLSFSTYFQFSISPENGDGLAFVFLPNGFPMEEFDGHSFGLSPGLKKRRDGVLAVEFDTSVERNVSDLNANHVGIDVGSLVSARVSNVSSVHLVLSSGNKLHSWIDYDASSKRLEVRLSKSGHRPYDPLLSYPINLFNMWKEEEMFVGISSSNGNSTQSTSIYSWSFRLRHVPSWLHSQPLDPNYSLPSKPLIAQEKNVCLPRILAALVFGIGCGALMVFIVLFMRAMFVSKQAVVVPNEYPVHPMEFGYEKIKVVAEKAATDAKKVEP